MARQAQRRKRADAQPHAHISVLLAKISQARLLPDHSAPRDDLFTFQYRVDLQNNSDDFLVITRRYWEFLDRGELIKVEAVSVGGQVLPRIAPGHTYSYITAVPFRVPSGTIRGRFSAQIEGGGETFADVPLLNFEALSDDVKAAQENRVAPAELVLNASIEDLKTIGRWIRRSTRAFGDQNKLQQLKTDELTVSIQTRQHLERLMLKSFYSQYEELDSSSNPRSVIEFSKFHSSFCDVFISDIFMLKGDQGFSVTLDYASNVHRILQRSLGDGARRRQRLPLSRDLSEAFYAKLSGLLELESVESVIQAQIISEIRLLVFQRRDAINVLEQSVVENGFDQVAEAILRRATLEERARFAEMALHVGEKPAERQHLSDAERQAFFEFAKANPWDSTGTVRAAAFIGEKFKPWLGRGLALSDIKVAQGNLAGAYSTEVSRYPERRVEGLYVKPHRAPKDAPIAKSSRRVTELSEEDLKRRRAAGAKRQAKHAAKLAAMRTIS